MLIHCEVNDHTPRYNGGTLTGTWPSNLLVISSPHLAAALSSRWHQRGISVSLLGAMWSSGPRKNSSHSALKSSLSCKRPAETDPLRNLSKLSCQRGGIFLSLIHSKVMARLTPPASRQWKLANENYYCTVNKVISQNNAGSVQSQCMHQDKMLVSLFMYQKWIKEIWNDFGESWVMFWVPADECGA